MVFSSNIFLFIFLPLTFVLYYLLPRPFKNLFLLLASLIFYAWGEINFAFIMLASIASNYAFALAISKFKNSDKAVLILAITLNLLLLVYFKYCSFFLSFFNITIDPIPLPLGISFFTFHSLSYVIDVYRKRSSPQKNIVDLGLYISNFAQLVAGPIIRYPDVSDQLQNRTHSLEKVVHGIKRFIIGLGKKVLIANTLATVADRIFNSPLSELDTKTAWLGLICYALQIYFDFSGYSDMAIGLGRMFGFQFLENFNYPYISKSIKEFWRRWHISLSNWFRDYVYIPLGGNKQSQGRTYLNLLIVFFLCGLWHGANWTFIIWGLWHGIFLIIERTRLGKALSKLPSPVRHSYTLLVILIGWVFFRSDTLEQSFQYLSTMFIYKNNTLSYPILDMDIVIAIIAGVIASLPILPLALKLKNQYSTTNGMKNKVAGFAMDGFILVVFLSTFLLSLMSLASGTYNPFIYFRF